MTRKKIGRASTSLSRGNECKTGCHNEDIVSDWAFPCVVLTQRTANCGLQGAKFRQQTNSAAEEGPQLPYTSLTPQKRAFALTDDDLRPSISTTRQGDLSYLPTLAQSHDEYDTFNTFDVQHLLHSDHTGQNLLNQQPQPDWSAFSRPIASKPMVSSRPAPSTSFQNEGDFSTAEVPASCSLPTTSANDSWNSRPLPDLLWTNEGIQNSSMHPANFLGGACNHLGGNQQFQSRHQHNSRPPTAISTSFVEQGAALRPASRGNEICQSPHEQPQSSRHAHYRHHSTSESANPLPEGPMSSGRASSYPSRQDQTQKYSSSQVPNQSTSDFGPTSPSTAGPASPLQLTNKHCSHCSCIPRPAPSLTSPKPVPPRNPPPTPTRPSTHVSPSRNLEILSECSLALRNLVQAPETINHVDKRKSGSGESSRKSGRISFAEYSPYSDRNSIDEGYDGDGERRDGVEKVVIVYMRAGSGGEVGGLRD